MKPGPSPRGVRLALLGVVLLALACTSAPAAAPTQPPAPAEVTLPPPAPEPAPAPVAAPAPTPAPVEPTAPADSYGGSEGEADAVTAATEE